MVSSARREGGARGAAYLREADPLRPGLVRRGGGAAHAAADRHDPLARAVQVDLLSRVHEVRLPEEHVRHGRAHDALEQGGREEHVAVGKDDVVPRELCAARPEREPRSLLELRVDHVAEPHAPVGGAERGPDHLLAVTDHEHGLLHAGRLEPVQQPRQEAPSAELDEALRPLLGEGREALAQARRQDEARHGFFAPLAPSSNCSSSCFVLSRWTRSAYPDCWMMRLNCDR